LICGLASDAFGQDDRVQERLTAPATRLEVIALRTRTLGLVRAAEDLSKVSAELRRLCDGAPARGEADDVLL
jgi:hypothetical protein